MIIENDMRAMADHLVEKCNKSTESRARTIKDIYGARWVHNPKQFRFLEGEILCLLGLAEHVKLRGVDSYLKFTKSHITQGVVTAVPKVTQSIDIDESRAETFVSNLVQKLKSLYMAQQIEDPEYDQFIEKLDHLDVKWLSTSDKDNLRAAVLCPICASEGHERRITLKVDAQGRWIVYSFTRHCDSFHYALPRVSRRKHFEGDEMDDGMDDSVSDSTSMGVQIKVEEGDSGPLGFLMTS